MLGLAGALWCGLGAPARAQSFKIQSLGTTNPVVLDINSVVGDDRGGIGLSTTGVFMTGDSATGRAPRDLSRIQSVGTRYDALCTDLRTETTYVLAQGTVPISYERVSNFTVDTLLKVDGETGALTGDSITLSQPISLSVNNGQIGIFSGFGRIVLFNNTGSGQGTVYNIAMPSGAVTTVGNTTAPDAAGSESLAYWGTAEFFGGELYLDYISSGGGRGGDLALRDGASDAVAAPAPRDTIQRQRVSDGGREILADFTAVPGGLSDGASFIISPRTRRWYFHSEGGSFFAPRGGVSELLGAADAVAGTQVTNTNDSGPGSLRQALLDSVGGAAILFDLPEGTEPVIRLLSPLPPVPANTVIDGTVGAAGVVTLDGSSAGANASGLVLSGGTSINGLSIRGFSGKGVVVAAGTANTIDRVTFAGNGLGIDLNNDGPSANDELDEDAGPNGGLNAPVLQSASTSGTATTLAGIYQGAPLATFRLQVFASPAANASGFGEGAAFLQEATVTTNARGRAAISIALPAQAAGATLTATARDAAGNTSEFSNAIAVGGGRASVASITVSENAGVATLQVLRDSPLGFLRLSYSTVDGTALAGSDYTSASGVVTFAPGETSKSVTVPLLSDNVSEPTESFTVSFKDNASGAQLATPSATVTITDTSPVPTLSLSDLTLAEGASGNVVATLSNPSSRPVTFDYITQSGTATSDADFPVRGGSLTFQPGQTSLQIPIATVDDALPEGDETFGVVASNAVNATVARNATVTISANDVTALPTISLGDASIREGTAGPAFATVPVTLSQAYPLPVTFDYITQPGSATPGSDYVTSGGSITIPAGQTSAQIVVSVLGDSIPEANESFGVVASNAVNATVARNATVTITNDDGLARLRITSPTPGAAYAVRPNILGGYNGAPELRVTVALRNSRNLFWNGRAFTRTRVELPAARRGNQWSLLPSFLPADSLVPEGALLTIATVAEPDRIVTEFSNVIIDRTAPTVAVTSPRDGALLAALGSISGTAQDTAPASTLASGASQVLVALRRGTDGAYWNGRTWARTFFAAPATLRRASWTLSRNLPSGANLSPGAYTVTAIAGDRAGNRSQATSAFRIISQPAG